MAHFMNVGLMYIQLALLTLIAFAIMMAPSLTKNSLSKITLYK